MPQNLSWVERDLLPDRWIRTKFGSLNLLVLHRYDEWRVSSWKDDRFAELPTEGDRQDLPSSLEWQRWDCADKDQRIRLLPGFPNHPVIARPNSSLTIAPGGHALFYVGIPASLEIHGQCGGTLRKLTSVFTDSLSKTWHGNRSAGEVCYSLRTRARRSYDPTDWPEQDIIVAVDLKNESKEEFVFERLFLDLGHFSIFGQGDRLWSNACRIRIGENDVEGNDVTYAPKPLSPAADAPEIVAARAGKTRRSKLQSAFSSVVDVIK